MLDKINKEKVVSNFVAVIGGLVLSSLAASLLGETLGYSALGIYVYGLFGHKMVAKFIENKSK